MVGKFHDELKTLKEEVVKMGYLSKKMLQESVLALKDIDEEKAKWVIAHKGIIADMDDNIEAEAFQLIALYQPMAKDMREI
ncbi:MAG: PhoU domain-containing protein, partial [Candidatus Thermoplasmatota archaeon]|nr:PhoU domain-containing protein [Candidatus Thermoplasmatota archaeon]